MANLPWTCECGRKVPWSIGVCRCGKRRPEPGETLGGGVDALAKLPQAQAQSGIDWSWLPKALGVLALIGLYFGSRTYNRYNASKEARAAAVQALSQVVDAKAAGDAVGKHHDECFEQYYKTGWGRRQSSSFDTEKYARCILDKSVGQIQRDTSSARIASMKAAQEERAKRQQQMAAAAAAAATPVPTPTEPTNWGQATLGDVKVVEFRREPQLGFTVNYVVLASGLTRQAHCLFSVACELQPATPPVVSGCSLQVEGVKGTGSLNYVAPGPAPAGGACTLELQLSDGRSTRTNKVSLPLR